MLQPLVVSEKAVLQRDTLGLELNYIQIANQTFNLGIPAERFDLINHLDSYISAASLYDPGGIWELLLLAIAQQLSPDMKERIHEGGLKEDRSTVHNMREIGHPELADLMDEWFDLADQVEIVIQDADGEYPYPEMANEREIQQKINDIHKRREPYLPDAPLSQGDIADMVCERFDLVSKPPHEAEQYWITQIIASEGFTNYRPPEDSHSWFLATRPFGWLTRRHGSALLTHGYSYKFAFWEREIGYTRGHLWIQTDRGPLRLTDTTDSASLSSNFPVQVSTIDGKALFKLRQSDVPDTLLRADQKTKPPPPMRAKKKSWFRFWN